MTRGTHRLSLALLLGCFAVVGLAQPPTAPPPRPVPTTTAELLVGRWKMVKCNLPVEIGVFTAEFTADGKCRVITENRNGMTDASGTYELKNRQLRWSLIVPNGQQEKPVDSYIDKVDRNTLVLIGIGEHKGQVTTWSRAR